jgi:hypothetical protein
MRENKILSVGLVNSFALWDIMPYWKVNRLFGWNYRLHIQGRRVTLLVSRLLYPSSLKMNAMFSPKYRSTFTGLRDVIPQKRELFIRAAVRITDLVTDPLFHAYLYTICKIWTTFRIYVNFDSKSLNFFRKWCNQACTFHRKVRYSFVVTVDKVALGRVFSECFGFPCWFSFYQLLHIRESSYNRRYIWVIAIETVS